MTAAVAGLVETAIAVTSSRTRSGAAAAGQREPVHHGELDDDGGEEGHGEDHGRERLAGWRGLGRHLLTTTPTTPRPVKSANGLTTAVGVSEPGWVVTVDTVPTGTPGT